MPLPKRRSASSSSFRRRSSGRAGVLGGALPFGRALGDAIRVRQLHHPAAISPDPVQLLIAVAFRYEDEPAAVRRERRIATPVRDSSEAAAVGSNRPDTETAPR